MKLIVEIDGRREEYTVREGTTVLGRDLDCDIPVVSGSISRRHLEVHFEGGELTVRDMGSRNGVFVNDRKVEEALVRPGEVVRAGRATLHFVRTGDMVASTAAMPVFDDAPADSPPPPPAAEDAPAPTNLPALADHADEPTPVQELPAVVGSRPLAAKVLTPLVRRALIALLALTVIGLGIIWLRQHRVQRDRAEGILTPEAHDRQILQAVQLLRDGNFGEAADHFARLSQYRTREGTEGITVPLFREAVEAEAKLAQDFGEHWEEAWKAWEKVERNVDRPPAARDYARERAEEINREALNLGMRDRAMHIFAEGDYAEFLQVAARIDPDSRFRHEINQHIVDARSRLTRRLTEEADRLADARRWDEAIGKLQEVSKHVPDMREQMNRRIAELEGFKADEASLAEGRRAVDRGDAARAEQALRRIADGSPYASERDALLGQADTIQARNRAQRLYDRGDAQAALDVLKEAGLAQDPLADRISTVKGLSEQLDQHLEEFQFQDADAVAQRIVGLETNRQNPFRVKADGYLRDRDAHRLRHAEQLLGEAKAAHRREEYYEAREKAEAALRVYPRLQEAATFVGVLKHEAERSFHVDVLMHREANPARALEAAKKVRDRLRPGEPFFARTLEIVRELEHRLRQEEE